LDSDEKLFKAIKRFRKEKGAVVPWNGGDNE